MSNYKVDQTDQKILELLKNNGRIQWREIGEVVHMTGQAVGERVRKLLDEGVIEGFYTKVKELEDQKNQTSFITIVMSCNDHKGFLNLMSKTSEVVNVYRTSGHGCYMIKVIWEEQIKLDDLLEAILKYGNYQVNIVLNEYK